MSNWLDLGSPFTIFRMSLGMYDTNFIWSLLLFPWFSNNATWSYSTSYAVLTQILVRRVNRWLPVHIPYWWHHYSSHNDIKHSTAVTTASHIPYWLLHCSWHCGITHLTLVALLQPTSWHHTFNPGETTTADMAAVASHIESWLHHYSCHDGRHLTLVTLLRPTWT